MAQEKRVIVALSREDYERLAAGAATEVRCPDQQATFLIRQALAAYPAAAALVVRGEGGAR
jgi:hypothetical protein